MMYKKFSIPGWKVPMSNQDAHFGVNTCLLTLGLVGGDEPLYLLLHQFLGDRQLPGPFNQKELGLPYLKECADLEESSCLKCRAERGREDSVVRFGCYLDCQLELLVFPLQLLCFRQRAGIDQAGIEHWLPIADPSQDLGSQDKNTGEWPLQLPQSCCCLWLVLKSDSAIFWPHLERGQEGSG